MYSTFIDHMCIYRLISLNQSNETNRKVKLKFWLISHSKIMTPPVHQFNCDRNNPVKTPPVLQVSS